MTENRGESMNYGATLAGRLMAERVLREQLVRLLWQRFYFDVATWDDRPEDEVWDEERDDQMVLLGNDADAVLALVER